MAKNFEITVKRKQEQNDYIEDTLSLSDTVNDLFIDQETKDSTTNKPRNVSKDINEVESEEKTKEKEDKNDEKDIKEIENIEEEKEEDMEHIENIEEVSEENIEETENKEDNEEKNIEEIEVKEELTEKYIEYIETLDEETKEEDNEKIEIKEEKKEEVIESIEEEKEEIIEEIRKEEPENNEEKLENFNKDIFCGRCRVYRSKKINIDKPKEDIVVKVGNIDRSMYIESVEMLKGGANIVTMVVENITYYTSKPLSNKKDKEEYKRNKSICKSYEKECICFDGDVRNTTVMTPYLIYIDVAGATENDDYEIESTSLDCISTKYVLDNGDIIDDNNSLPFNYIENLIQEYEITISIILK